MKQIKYIYTAIVLVQPLLVNYEFYLFGTFADIVLIIGVGLIVIDTLAAKKIKGKDICFTLIPFFLYMLCLVIYQQVIGKVHGAEIKFVVRVSFYLASIIFFGKKYFDVEFGYKLYKTIAIAATVWLIAQTISMSIFHKFLPGYLNFLPIREDLRTDINYINYPKFYRARSFFQEPAHYAQYILGTIALTMFDRKNKSRNLFLVLFLTFGILLSGSSTGILVCFIQWLLYLLHCCIRKKITRGMGILGLFGILLLGVVLNTSQFMIFIIRFFVNQSAISGRFSGIIQIVNDMGIQNLFGMGLDISSVISGYGWIPSIAILLWIFGNIGGIIYLSIFFYLLWKPGFHNKCLVCTYLLLLVGTDIIFDTFGFLYLCLLFSNPAVSMVQASLTDRRKEHRHEKGECNYSGI